MILAEAASCVRIVRYCTIFKNIDGDRSQKVANRRLPCRWFFSFFIQWNLNRTQQWTRNSPRWCSRLWLLGTEQSLWLCDFDAWVCTSFSKWKGGQRWEVGCNCEDFQALKTYFTSGHEYNMINIHILYMYIYIFISTYVCIKVFHLPTDPTKCRMHRSHGFDLWQFPFFLLAT